MRPGLQGNQGAAGLKPSQEEIMEVRSLKADDMCVKNDMTAWRKKNFN